MKSKDIILFTFILILVFMNNMIFAQQKMSGVKVTDAGTFSGLLNGKEFNDMIRYSESNNLVAIATGDKNFTLTINWSGINHITEIKTGEHKLPADENVTVLFVDNNAAVPFLLSTGKLIITKSDGQLLKGTLEFSANAAGLPKEMGGTEALLSNGNFKIKLKK